MNGNNTAWAKIQFVYVVIKINIQKCERKLVFKYSGPETWTKREEKHKTQDPRHHQNHV